MGALDNWGIKITSKCLWDVNSDNYATYTYKNENFFCTAMVFGLYNEWFKKSIFTLKLLILLKGYHLSYSSSFEFFLFSNSSLTI